MSRTSSILLAFLSCASLSSLADLVYVTEQVLLDCVISPLNASDAGALDVEEQGLLPPGKAR